MSSQASPAEAPGVDSPYAWSRLMVTLALMTIGASGMYIVPVVLPVVQADFGIARADAALPYSMLMLGWGVGGMLAGRLADRFGILVPLVIGAISMGAGYAISAYAPNILVFGLAHGFLIGLFGGSSTFAPLMADTTLWFEKRRGMAVAICASGNYLGGTIWPPVVQYFVETLGWRQTYIGMAIFCGITMFLLALCMRRRPPLIIASRSASGAVMSNERPFGMSQPAALALLMIAGVACCVAMSMPQVHIVAYCGDLGYGAARGAEMLSIMLGFGIVSRLFFGWLCDRIGGLLTLLTGSFLQMVALFLFLPFDGLVPLYVISALFGLFQGGIVPAYAIIVREHFPAAKVGATVGTVIMCTLAGMALGGWMSGKVFDLTGSYQAAFINGILWNWLNLAIAGFLFWRVRGLRLARA
ncbi:MFS transporter [Usitatibacter palustris]|uniref:L-lactate transporter n=1 Tax=Usitatibacter palustris TaxID=2732487 RepID=A0A6M4HEI4_9PROT|nr:MFS transporter [Usitatibacter palustris]QJR16943.1 L-lactate transporter [Usitatibacter palustris]